MSKNILEINYSFISLARPNNLSKTSNLCQKKKQSNQTKYMIEGSFEMNWNVHQTNQT